MLDNLTLLSIVLKILVRVATQNKIALLENIKYKIIFYFSVLIFLSLERAALGRFTHT